MIVSARTPAEADLACDIAALLEGPPIARGGRKEDIDLEGLIGALHGSGEADRVARTLIHAESRRLKVLVGRSTPVHEDSNSAGNNIRQAGLGSGPPVHSSLLSVTCGLLLALAYPDRIAQRRGDAGRRYVLANGTGALLPEWSQLSRHPYLAVGDVDGEGVEARIFLAAPLDRDTILKHFAALIESEQELGWNEASASVFKRQVSRLGAITLAEQTVEPSDEEAAQILLQAIARSGLTILPWTQETLRLRERSEWLRRNGLADRDWPDLSDERLVATLPEWLGPHVRGLVRLDQLKKLDSGRAFRSLLDERRRRELDRLAPTHLQTPAGSRVALEYGDGPQPVMAVRLQEMFGQSASPSVGGGKVRVLLHLLSPAGRPLAVTSDLSSFWTNAYPDVRKQMRGRYPKHPWPEDPRHAVPHTLRRPRK